MTYSEFRLGILGNLADFTIYHTIFPRKTGMGKANSYLKKHWYDWSKSVSKYTTLPVVVSKTPLMYTKEGGLILPKAGDEIYIKAISLEAVNRELANDLGSSGSMFLQEHTMLGISNDLSAVTGGKFLPSMDWTPIYYFIEKNAEMQKENDLKWDDPDWVIARILQKVGAYRVIKHKQVTTTYAEVASMYRKNTENYFLSKKSLDRELYAARVADHIALSFTDFEAKYKGEFWEDARGSTAWHDMRGAWMPFRQLKVSTVEYVTEMVNKSFEKGGELHKQKLQALLSLIEET
jgi:hypothetical protein